MIKDFEAALKKYHKEVTKNSIHHFDINLPEHDGRCWILPAVNLPFENEIDEKTTIIYFSVNKESRKGKRVMQTIELLEPFSNYTQIDEPLYMNFYRITNGQAGSIARELSRITETLFPSTIKESIQMTFILL